MPARWSLFCAMIDNFGDIGVCWRLARQLKQEYGIDVDLWVDDWSAAGRFLSAQQPSLQWQADDSEICVSGISLLRWSTPWPQAGHLNQRIADSDRIIEAFGCELPEAVKAAMAQRHKPLVWINLEYLSAEPWVAGCHGLPSPQSYSPLLKKYFFFPGFAPETGGLLREAGVIKRHTDWQSAMAQSRHDLLARLFTDGRHKALGAEQYNLVVSVFSYETPSFGSWLSALAEGADKVLCLVPEGRSLASFRDFLDPRPETGSWLPGSVLRQGNLTVAILPFMSQGDYDQLLSVCDFNLVRGEDSFVRAQWAANPFMWHIYPQHDGVHIRKLEAFAECYLQGLQADAREAWLCFARGWNLGEDCREMWHYLRPQLPVLLLHTREWQKELAVMPDLATNLVKFKTLLN